MVNQKQGTEKNDQEILSNIPTAAAKTGEKLSSIPHTNQADSTVCYVDVKGEVKHPGVYKAELNNRVQDVVGLAGGFKSSADVNQINLAEKLHDEMVIYIPKKGERTLEAGTSGMPSAGSSQLTQTNGGSSQAKVNINTATAEELQKIPGVGPSKANAIIDYRTQNGLFKQEEDLKNVKGIGDKTYEKLADFITVK
jgi:competence protein ComEA